jgi:hypothetical protein
MTISMELEDRGEPPGEVYLSRGPLRHATAWLALWSIKLRSRYSLLSGRRREFKHLSGLTFHPVGNRIRMRSDTEMNSKPAVTPGKSDYTRHHTQQNQKRSSHVLPFSS